MEGEQSLSLKGEHGLGLEGEQGLSLEDGGGLIMGSSVVTRDNLKISICRQVRRRLRNSKY